MKKRDFTNKKVGVLGLGKSGLSVALFLKTAGAEVIANEGRQLSGSETEKTLQAAGITVVSGEHPEGLFADCNFIVKSPGISYKHDLLQEALEKGTPIYTDIEILSPETPAKIVGITGTNGKSTTTSLVVDILNHCLTEGKAYASGNIGIPLAEVLPEVTPDDVLVTELSSFQLMGTETYKPAVAIITNLYSAHLDYHENRDNYVEAKKQLIKNLTSDEVFIYNADQAELVEWAAQTPAQLIPFSRLSVLEQGVYAKEGKVYYGDEYICERSDIRIPGTHNLENALAAIALAKAFDLSHACIIEVLRTYAGMVHRLQFVKEWQGRKIYNDSKATNFLASQNALESFEEPIVLLAGGLDRKEDLSPLLPMIKKHVKAMFVQGENQADFIELAKKAKIPVMSAATMEEAVSKAFEESAKGDVILFSPASASWDQYESFEIRGEAFMKAVEDITKEEEK